MGGVESCCQGNKDDKMMVTKMDLSHCGCIEVPSVVFNAERCIETLILSSNQITSLPPQLFHCQELKHLNLIDNGLTSVPPAIGSLLHLVSLKLDKNNMKDLPENLKMCRKLKRLSLSNNQWKQMPNIVTQLISLEELYMSDCELSFLPASIGRLTKLKIIELRNNSLCNLPLSMSRLATLSRLDIGDNEFTEFPACINSLSSLKELLVDNNDIEEITEINNLEQLEHLDASYNHISSVSETIGCCTNICLLNLSFNYIEQLPETLGKINQLQTLLLEMNELAEIPKSIGQLSNLEELNLCNNNLYNIPNSIGLLRNLRTLNVSRNHIEEFPTEIGSCTKLSIVNASYNRLQVLPSEIGYLSNLKVLDLVGNFLMYLPITIINLSGVRAIWLSANQNVPLIPFTEDLNIASGERFLTNIALPQLGEIPMYNHQNSEKMDVSDKTASWSKRIRFAEDDDILPGKLHRTPTPFPKELRAPNRKHHSRNEDQRSNYVNIVDGKVSDQETFLQPPSLPITKNVSGLLNFTESSVTMIREANIRRNKDVNLEANSSDAIRGDTHVINMEPYAKQDIIETEVGAESTFELKGSDEGSRNDGTLAENMSSDLAGFNNDNERNLYQQNSSIISENCIDTLANSVVDNSNNNNNNSNNNNNCLSNDTRGSGLTMSNINSTNDNHIHNQSQLQQEEYDPSNLEEKGKGSLNENLDYTDMSNQPPATANADTNHLVTDTRGTTLPDSYNEIIYSNLANNSSLVANGDSDYCRMDAQSIREMYHNDIIYGTSGKTPSNNSSNSSRNGFTETKADRPKYLGLRNTTLNRLNNGTPPPFEGPPYVQHDKVSQVSHVSQSPYLGRSGRNESERPPSKQDLVSITERMRSQNISPPCYEIAKMYSTKAALFERRHPNN